ncbi:GapA-binding peptide SR1P [Bacillus sp. 1NLA3E]|nr:GapA-binding peptide SR1P [Bacillus sp. 1NLA3E]
MSSIAVVKQGTIVCQVCGKEIGAVENVDSVKTWYGICHECVIKKKK